MREHKFNGKGYKQHKAARDKLLAFAPFVGDATVLVAAQDNMFYPVVIYREAAPNFTPPNVGALIHNGITVIN